MLFTVRCNFSVQMVKILLKPQAKERFKRPDVSVDVEKFLLLYVIFCFHCESKNTVPEDYNQLQELKKNLSQEGATP